MNNIELNLYDVNKQAMNEINPMETIDLYTACFETTEKIWDHCKKPHYWMLLCREKSDFTVFKLVASKDEFAEALIDCLENRGETLDITERPDGAYEIWIRIGNENVVYYLFDYDNAIIEV
jgi:hypothetical protein